MKARLVKGPFAGRVIKWNGSPTLIMAGPKKMTRKQQWDLHINQINSGYYGGPLRSPQVEAEYRIAYRVHSTGDVLADNAIMANLPCMHPDGSIFYEYVEGSKREYS